MAEEDAEIALLHSMQAGQEQWNDEAEGVAEEGQPINTEDSEEQEQEPEPEPEKETIADEDHGAQSTVRSPATNGAISAMSGVQNPVIAAINSNPESRTSSRASNRATKPKTVGGFIADDSEEEDNATPISAAIGLQQTPAAESVSHTPLQSSNDQIQMQWAHRTITIPMLHLPFPVLVQSVKMLRKISKVLKFHLPVRHLCPVPLKRQDCHMMLLENSRIGSEKIPVVTLMHGFH